ncbi:hypothetical protein MtrunA17_Chr3g0136891 [Medicago truncatula]|uniref:Transmembrane protein n=1 Tax=Medicago truncatula TaxID=3880 RepID=A0A396J1J0_MEDTR|nr:hypothetical protein MtrunA17_Chr3g0136891 [Medicago truncatula]
MDKLPTSLFLGFFLGLKLVILCNVTVECSQHYHCHHKERTDFLRLQTDTVTGF